MTRQIFEKILDENEKANPETLNKKLMADLGGVNKTVLTWSLIEE